MSAPGSTAVFYMGVARLEHIVAKLLEHGAPGSRPAAIVAQGTTPNQRIIAATLATIERASADAGLAAPALLIVGDVVALQPALGWFNAGGGSGETGASSEAEISRTA